MLASIRGPLSDQRLPASQEVPEAATGRRASERLPMSTRNGTLSSANPQPQSSTAASGGRRPSEEEEVSGMEEQTKSAAGIDWAKDEHALCVIEEASGRKIFEGRFAHQEGGLTKLCRTLVEMGVERVAIERPEGILVERVLDAALTVPSTPTN
jgi:hypothetical protein